MDQQINIAELKDNPYFWHLYLKWFRGFDEENELNIDEALATVDIDQDQVQQWEENFFSTIHDDHVSFINGELNDKLAFHIEFQESEIVFFLNETYIGNLGGHFEAWFLTWEELLAFEKQELFFLLLLPMTGIEKHQVEEAKTKIATCLKTIPSFTKEATYIARCIVNGLAMDQDFFIHDDFGIINRQNHSVRNLEEYPRYQDEVKLLNMTLSSL